MDDEARKSAGPDHAVGPPPLDRWRAAIHTGEVRAVLARLGTPIGAYDGMLAGHARSMGLAVVTHNTREFSRVPGLVVENWLA